MPERTEILSLGAINDVAFGRVSVLVLTDVDITFHCVSLCHLLLFSVGV